MRHFLRAAAVAISALVLTVARPVSADTVAPQAAAPQPPSAQLANLYLPTIGLAPPAKAVIQPAVAVTESGSLADIVAATLADLTTVDEQLRCLATAVYYESRSEPLEGQLAVAQVVVNRTHSGRFPASVCGVVNQPSQFSFSHRHTPGNQAQWTRAVKIAMIAMANGWHAIVPDALYFHAAHISTGWKHRIARIGNNVFYR